MRSHVPCDASRTTEKINKISRSVLGGCVCYPVAGGTQECPRACPARGINPTGYNSVFVVLGNLFRSVVFDRSFLHSTCSALLYVEVCAPWRELIGGYFGGCGYEA